MYPLHLFHLYVFNMVVQIIKKGVTQLYRKKKEGVSFGQKGYTQK